MIKKWNQFVFNNKEKGPILSFVRFFGIDHRKIPKISPFMYKPLQI